MRKELTWGCVEGLKMAVGNGRGWFEGVEEDWLVAGGWKLAVEEEAEG